MIQCIWYSDRGPDHCAGQRDCGRSYSIRIQRDTAGRGTCAFRNRNGTAIDRMRQRSSCRCDNDRRVFDDDDRYCCGPSVVRSCTVFGYEYEHEGCSRRASRTVEHKHRSSTGRRDWHNELRMEERIDVCGRAGVPRLTLTRLFMHTQRCIGHEGNGALLAFQGCCRRIVEKIRVAR